MVQVFGFFELLVGVKMMIDKYKFDVVICLGCVIKGEIFYNEYINQVVASGFINLSMVYGKFFIFGVFMLNIEEQACDCVGGKYGNKGVEVAVIVICMVVLKEDLKVVQFCIGFF